MLWVIFAALTGIAVFSILWPLARSPRGTQESGHDVAFYKAQLEEIARENAAARLSPEDMEAAKVEASRRLIAAAEQDAGTAAPNSRWKLRIAAVASLLFVPLLTLGLYHNLGHPNWPDAPLLARLNASPDHIDVAAAVAKVEAHLAQHPEDGRGYEVLIPVYIRLGRFDDAVRMAEAAMAKLGETPQRLTVYGETLMAAARGEVTPQAREAFEKAAVQKSAPPEAMFYLGVGAAQKGEFDKAKEIWEKLLASAPPDAPWREDVAQRIAELSHAPNAPSAVPAGGEAIANMAPAEQQQAIRGMVGRLAARLEENGQDIDGWLRLIRAYVVLNDVDKARDALGHARKNFDADAAARARIDALAHELGLDS